MNKVLVIVYVPFLEEKYEVFIPINKKVGTIKDLLIKSITELSNIDFNKDKNLKLYDKETGSVLSNNLYIKESNIFNGKKLILM